MRPPINKPAIGPAKWNKEVKKISKYWPKTFPTGAMKASVRGAVIIKLSTGVNTILKDFGITFVIHLSTKLSKEDA